MILHRKNFQTEFETKKTTSDSQEINKNRSIFILTKIKWKYQKKKSTWIY